jgi:predicted nucleic acid-binding protein
MTLVLDSSVTLAFVYLDELTPATSRLAEAVQQSGAWVPSIWRLEIANSLQGSFRRRRINAEFRDNALTYLSSMQIQVDTETDAFAWSTTLQLADNLGLTPYDACYLELAQRRDLPLATLDRDLRSAGKKLGIALL